MDSSLLALLVAAVGVVGTLVAPVLASVTANRAKKQEMELTLLHEQANRTRADDRARFVELRNCYIGLNMAARGYQNAMRTTSHALESSTDGIDDALPQLQAARSLYREKYGEAQMIVSDSVLPDMSRVNRLLADSYGTLMRIVSGHGGPGDTPDGVRELLDLALEQLRAMRASMRQDLGIRPPA